MIKFILNLIMTGFFILGIVVLSFAQQSVTAVKGPDLIVEKIECGKGNKLLFTIKNIGTGPLPSGWVGKSHVWINGRSLFDSIGLDRPISTTGGGIANVGGTSTYEAPYVITTGITVKVETDYGNHIRELNEGNNSKTVKLQPCDRVGKPDLTVTLTGPFSARRGADIGPLMKIEVRNIGTETAMSDLIPSDIGCSSYIIETSTTWRMERIPTDSAYRTGHGSCAPGFPVSLSPGESWNFTVGVFSIPNDAIPGVYEICTHVDSSNLLVELREDNNKSCIKLSVTP